MNFDFITISREKEKTDKLLDNISAFMFIEAENKSNGWTYDLKIADGSKLDIFEGYNSIGLESEADYLIFLHDDVELLGRASCLEPCLKLLDKPMTGIIGAAGSRTMPADGCWWHAPQEELRGAVFHPSQPSKDFDFGMHLNCWPWQGAKFGRVTVLDGVFLMMKTSTFKKLKGFDGNKFSGFHFYDVLLSTKATLAGLSNYVAPLHVYHKSPGVPNDNWEVNRQIYLKTYGSKLPLKVK